MPVKEGRGQSGKEQKLPSSLSSTQTAQEGVTQIQSGSFALGYFWGPSGKGQRSWLPSCHQGQTPRTIVLRSQKHPAPSTQYSDASTWPLWETKPVGLLTSDAMTSRSTGTHSQAAHGNVYSARAEQAKDFTKWKGSGAPEAHLSSRSCPRLPGDWLS